MDCADLRIEDAISETMCFAAVHESGFGIVSRRRESVMLYER
jgi:hypothetical protein